MGLFSSLRNKKVEVPKEPQVKNEQEEKDKQIAKDRVYELLATGQALPNLKDVPIVLTKSEICHYCSKSLRVEKKLETVGYKGRHAGMSMRVAKGISLRAGSGRGEPIKEDVFHEYPGYIFITSKKVVFMSDNKGFVINLNKIISKIPYTDGIGLQNEKTTYLVKMEDPKLFTVILNGALNNIS